MKNTDFPIFRDPNDSFSKLTGQKAWAGLSQAVRNRFERRLKGGASVAYQGQVTSMRMNWAGRLLAMATRVIGAPLPYDLSSVDQPAVVTVTEDIAGSGQFWIRQYGRRAGFPQVIHSSKRFGGPTGLEEYIGYGIGMALNVSVEGPDLLFKSDHYFVQVFGLRIRIPRALSPGDLVIGHHDQGDGSFRFSLNLRHPLFGQMIFQDALFHDTLV